MWIKSDKGVRMGKLEGFVINRSCELKNALTKYIDDNYLDGDQIVRDHFGTYIYLDDCSDKSDGFKIYPIRVPGATRGCIMVTHENVLLGVEICETSYAGNCPSYFNSIKDEKFEDFIGEELFY